MVQANPVVDDLEFLEPSDDDLVGEEAWQGQTWCSEGMLLKIKQRIDVGWQQAEEAIRNESEAVLPAISLLARGGIWWYCLPPPYPSSTFECEWSKLVIRFGPLALDR